MSLFRKKMKAEPEDDKTIFKALGMVYDVRNNDVVEFTFNTPYGTIGRELYLPGHHLRIGEFVTVEYRRGKK